MCKYCDKAVPLVTEDRGDRGMAIVFPNTLIAYGYDVHGAGSNGITTKINYCPMCGKRISDEVTAVRLIDANKLINDIKYSWDWESVDGITATTVLKQIITDIENQPTAYQWIPCRKRLPDKGLRVLMQLDNAWQIVGWYDKEDKQWFELVWGDPVANDRVLAWMELPQSYGENDEI